MSQRPKTVLILDDDEAVRESLTDYFEDRGLRVLPARSAEDALGVLKLEEPDGAVVDIRLPGMDGNAFIRAACGTHPTLACVICTGSPEYRRPEDFSAFPHVADKIFVKPVTDLGELAEALRVGMNKIADQDDEE